MSRARRPARFAAASRRRSTRSTRSTRSVVRSLAWRVAAATSLALAAAPAVVGAADGPVRSAEVCTSEEHRWSGSLDLAGRGATATTEMAVPVVEGTWLRVAGLSADGLDASGVVHPVAVIVGTAPAAVGAAIDAGIVGVRAIDDVAVTVSGVTVVVDRCREVASAGANEVNEATGEVPSDLPASGGRVGMLTAVGALALGAGLGMRAIARRRHC